MHTIYISAPRELKLELKHATEWFLGAFLPRFHLEITIFVNDDIEVNGYCEYLDSNIRPRLFQININKEQDRKEIFVTLFHELVHMKQYVKGEIRERYKPTHCIWWKKRKYVSLDNYDALPWEREAHKMESILYDEWQQSY